ncbi:protease 2-like isoform X1 [Orbicella faveolata]|uniref:protease 2-like isoform X1 n=1 Tax=Orbicella faveolata TaxID=48498 RepID=UPI0009E64C59|nr:protease 2-like isoform X1 [Orbicella faveolata]
MRIYRLLKATFASRAPLHSHGGSRGLSSIGFLSRLFGASPSEPRPKKDPSYQTVHGVELQDDFHWLKKRGSKAVRKYIKQENRYADAVLADTEVFQEKLVKEMNEIIEKHFDNESVPEELDGYVYHLSNPPKNFYLPVYRRRKILEDGSYGDPETILDENELLERYSHVDITKIKMSPSGKYIGFLLDKSGEGTHSLYITEAHEGIINFIDAIPKVVNFEWGSDDLSLYYTRADDNNRPYTVLWHKTCQSILSDVVLYEEEDERYIVDVSVTKDRKFITINCNSRSTSEVSIVDIRDGSFISQPLHPRQQGMEYYVDHRDDRFYIITNADDKNYRVMTAPKSNPGKENWETFVTDKTEIFLDDMDVFQNYCVVYERQRTVPQLRIVPFDKPEDQYIVQLPKDICVLEAASNLMYDHHRVRLSVSSPILPACVLEYNMETKSMVEKHSFSDLPSIDSSDFCCTRHEIQSKDGTHIPVTLFHHKDLKKDGNNPLLLHVYGSYGINVSMGFDVERISLLKRGWCLAFCHVRGGGELGRQWYLEGKLQSKHKSFEDFEACTQALHRMGYSHPQLTAARGTSAGGLIVGAVCNRSPGLFKAAILRVPFLDILTSMLDPSLPLTIQEYEEWGEPGSNESDFHYIRSYCPYQNIKNQPYPSVMVTSAMNDDRVPYWLPIKWVAHLRDQLSGQEQSDKPLIVCHVDYYGRHSETEGTYRRIEKAAKEYAFLHKALGLPLE